MRVSEHVRLIALLDDRVEHEVPLTDLTPWRGEDTQRSLVAVSFLQLGAPATRSVFIREQNGDLGPLTLSGIRAWGKGEEVGGGLGYNACKSQFEAKLNSLI